MKKLLLVSFGILAMSHAFADDPSVSQSISTNIVAGGNTPTMAVISTTKTTLNIQDASAGQPLFAGHAAACFKGSTPGQTNCCATTGWGTDPSLAECTDSEKNLAVAKNAGLATYIGDSCMQDSSGACVAPISVYCVFPDKASYQMQEEGKHDQLGGGFGTPAQPDCSGLTQSQVKQIDLTKINFTGTSISITPQVESSAS